MAKEIEIKNDTLFNDLCKIIEIEKREITIRANNGVVMMFWKVGKRINNEILNNERAIYGKQIVNAVSSQLQLKYGNTFHERNVRRMIQFATQFPDSKIVSPLATQLSWTHIVELLPLPMEAKLYYANEVRENMLSKRDLRYLISRKTFERREIANAQLTQNSLIPFNTFKDPYLLDVLGLKENFLEADLENAILKELEKFILEFGKGFAFIDRQKRITIGDKDFYIDLLFFHRELKRLVVIELKIGEFKAAHKGQLELYLKWLDKNERKEGENAPIGIILCTNADKDQIELLQLDKSGIAVAEFWTKLPPKKELHAKINQIMAEAQERLERRKQLGKGTAQKQIEYFIEPDEEE